MINEARARNFLLWARAYMQAHARIRKFIAHASLIIYARASASILARTSMCLFFCERASASIRACSSVSICACGGCSICLYVVLPNKLSIRSHCSIYCCTWLNIMMKFPEEVKWRYWRNMELVPGWWDWLGCTSNANLSLPSRRVVVQGVVYGDMWGHTGWTRVANNFNIVVENVVRVWMID